MARSWSISSQSENADPREGKGAYWALAVVTLVYAMNIADRFVLSTLIEPIKAEFQLSDASVGFLTGVALAIFYPAAGLPLGALADRANRRNMLMWAITIWRSEARRVGKEGVSKCRSRCWPVRSKKKT